MSYLDRQYYHQQTLPTPPEDHPDPPNPHQYTHQHNLPKVGQTRCYWAMLSADLTFIYLDPVLASHLEDQADLLIGKSLFSFVHPDEQASAKQDLGGVLESRTLHGSVTRVRFSRLSRVRRQLGYDGPGPTWSDAEKIAVDKDYMAVDIVINWAAEGLVLCFIHASVDLDPNDNNEYAKTDWTNWCGTPWMPPEQISLLSRCLLMYIPQSGSMNRVFQILANQRDRPLLLSWPPDSPQGPSSRDFAKLVENVQIGAGVPGGNDAKTSCTRRYKALQDMPVFGGEVESIFIPHGSIIFACHKVNPSRTFASAAPTMQTLAYSQPSYNSQQNASYYDHGASYSLPPLSSPTQTYSNTFMSSQGPAVQTSYSPQRWNQSSLPPSMSNLRSGSYSGGSPTQPASPWSQQSSASPTYMEAPVPPFNRSISPSYNAYSPTTSSAGISPTSDVVPPPRRRISPGSARDHTGPTRGPGNRPTGIQKCSSCKATSSPEWRKGPSGKKELCNACGLRYARSRAKKEGSNQTQARRRKEKGLVSRRDSPPPTLANPPYPPIRRSYPDSSFSASSTGSPSGSEAYPHSAHHMLDNMTPSPSPPSSNMSFVHYAPGGPDGRGPPYHGSTAFYPGPSPLANQAVLSSQDHPQGPAHHSILPPLGQLSSYAGRISPLGPHSPGPSSAMSAPSSYERDRDRDYRELPHTPLSAEPRHGNSRRPIPTQQ